MLWFFKTTIITGLLGAGLLLPVGLLTSYLNPWKEAIQIADEKYPENLWIPRGGRSSGRIINGSFIVDERELTILLIPSNNEIYFQKHRGQNLSYEIREGGVWSFLIGIVVLYSLFYWQARKTPKRIKNFFNRNSRYL